MHSVDFSLLPCNDVKKGILVVEDEPVVASHIENLLVSMEYSVVAKSESAEKAIDNARKYRPDLILMDIKLQGKLDGIDAALLINREMKVPIIYLTGWMSDELVNRAKETVPFGYIVKPFHNGELKAMIELALHRDHIEQQRSHAKNHYRGILDHMADAFISVDFNGAIQFCNTAAEDMLGINAAEMGGKPVSALMAGPASEPYVKKMNEILLRVEKLDKVLIEHVCFDTSQRKVVAEVAFVPCRSMDNCFITLVIHDLKTDPSGILPMCAHCKKVRVESCWIAVEEYFRTNLRVVLTHSICPECITSYFPDIHDIPPDGSLQ